MFQIFTRTMTADGFGPRKLIGYCDTAAEAVEYCRHAGEWESKWVLTHAGWRGNAGRAYEWTDVGQRYSGQRVKADWAPLTYLVDGVATQAMGLRDLPLTGTEIVKRGDDVWINRDGVWRRTMAKKYVG